MIVCLLPRFATEAAFHEIKSLLNLKDRQQTPVGHLSGIFVGGSIAET